MRFLLVVLALLLATPGWSITLEEAQAEAEAWVNEVVDIGPPEVTRLEELAADFAVCASINLRNCHPRNSASVLPNTDPGDEHLATVTNDDPGIWTETACGACWVDRDRFVDAGVDIPVNTPVLFYTNTFQSIRGVSIQLVIQIKYDNVVYERGYTMFGPDSGDFDWQEVI